MKEKYRKILERVSVITDIPLATLHDHFVTLSHDAKRAVIHDLSVVLRNYKGSLEELKKLGEMFAKKG